MVLQKSALILKQVIFSEVDVSVHHASLLVLSGTDPTMLSHAVLPSYLSILTSLLSESHLCSVKFSSVGFWT